MGITEPKRNNHQLPIIKCVFNNFWQILTIAVIFEIFALVIVYFSEKNFSYEDKIYLLGFTLVLLALYLIIRILKFSIAKYTGVYFSFRGGYFNNDDKIIKKYKLKDYVLFYPKDF